MHPGVRDLRRGGAETAAAQGRRAGIATVGSLVHRRPCRGWGAMWGLGSAGSWRMLAVSSNGQPAAAALPPRARRQLPRLRDRRARRDGHGHRAAAWCSPILACFARSAWRRYRASNRRGTARRRAGRQGQIYGAVPLADRANTAGWPADLLNQGEAEVELDGAATVELGRALHGLLTDNRARPPKRPQPKAEAPPPLSPGGPPPASSSKDPRPSAMAQVASWPAPAVFTKTC